MAPAVGSGDTWVYLKTGTPQVGEVVVLRLPDEPGLLHVKRIVASPGQEVQLADGRLYVDGQRVGKDLAERTQWRDTDCVLRESSTLREEIDGRRWEVFSGGDHEPELVGPGQYWLLGDNRGGSSDSRHWGAVDARFIVGKLWLRLASRDRCGQGE